MKYGKMLREYFLVNYKEAPLVILDVFKNFGIAICDVVELLTLPVWYLPMTFIFWLKYGRFEE
jgi:hypothetical protein